MREVSEHLTPAFADLVDRPGSVAGTTFMADVVEGLGAQQKRLPAKYFYDAAGSALFEEITRLPEYYPTRTEIAILRARRGEFRRLVPAGAVLIEFGSGSSTKIRIVLDDLPDLAVYVPVDVSGEMLLEEADTLRRDYSRLAIRPVIGDFARPFDLPREAIGRARIGFFPGSTIGNFDKGQAAAFLAHARDMLGLDGVLVVGVDLVKDGSVLAAAYDDAAGVTARFNLNVLERINRELGADFDLDGFTHRAILNADESRMEMHLVSRVRQEVGIGPHHFSFEAGETIHTENSYKYTIEGFRDLARSTGWQPRETWTDPDDLFSIHILANEPRT